MLQEALEDWREEKTAAIYGWAALNDLGPSLVMPNATLDRIVDCAHHYKIQTVQDLHKETAWTDSERFGAEVIALIQKHSIPPQTPFISTPIQRCTLISSVNINAPPSGTSQTGASSQPLEVAVKRRNKCSACGREGHNGM